MGGSFNPPHAGHLGAAETALRRLALDRVWWLVTPGNPLKAHDGLPPLAKRMAACRTLASHPRFAVTGFEAELGSPYTAVTLAFLRRRYPGTRFVWIMGADNLATFHRWQDWRGIARTLPMAVVDRPHWRLKAMASPAALAFSRRRVAENRSTGLPRRRAPAWTFLTARLHPQSSTSLRSAAKKGVRTRR